MQTWLGSWRRWIGVRGARVPAIKVVTVAVAIAVLPGGSALSASADPGPRAGGMAATSASVTAADLFGGHRATRITLITGDTVTFVRDVAGRVSVTVEPRPDGVDDGADMVYRGYQEGDDYYVIPDNVRAYVEAGVLDRRLFNLTYLADNGYADDETSRLPLIVQYRQRAAVSALAQNAKSLPGRAASRALAAVNGAAVAVGKKRAGAFWTGVVGPLDNPGASVGRLGAAEAPMQLGQGVSRVWLDAKVETVDDQSNTQIGAPTAWAAGFTGAGVDVGIIDTGIDVTHPDLAGKVVAARSFVAGEDPADIADWHGHGTHVASIVAGDGDASGGRHKGVAPDGELIMAKVFDDDTGFALESWVIEAMEWQAATQHARIVNMSLGSLLPTDGTDPQSQAVNALTAQYGTLFVIAAGNSGPAPRSVVSPGAATAALTVGAVDSSDRLAAFSSRGPRLGDFAIKPEITAPGVGIIAARAAGTSMGNPVDAHYTAASGTSMAAPHVAGAAAILAQQHPNWTADQIKNALIGTAHDIGYSAYEQGAGRLDVARAVTQQVFHDTPSISAVRETVTRQVAYYNHGSTPVTLTLSAHMERSDGTAAPAGMVTLSADTITAPAAGVSSVEVTITPTAGEPGIYTGLLLATSTAGDELTVPIAARNGLPYRTVRVRIVADTLPVVAPGNVGIGSACAVVVNDDEPALRDEPSVSCGRVWHEAGDRVYETTLSLAEGIYDLDTFFRWGDNRSEDHDSWSHEYRLLRPQVDLDQDTVVTFDLNTDVVPISVDTPRPSESVFMNEIWERFTASGRAYFSVGIRAYPAFQKLYVTPTTTPSVGSFRYHLNDTRIAPQVIAVLQGTRRVDLRPRYVSEFGDVPKFTSNQRLEVVTEVDLRAGRDVRGKLILANHYPLIPLEHDDNPTEKYADFIRLATRAGAAGVITDSIMANAMRNYPDPNSPDPELNRIPLLRIDKTAAAQARADLAVTKQAWVNIRAQLITPYEYKLNNYLYDRIPATVAFSFRPQELTAIETTYHGQYEQPMLQWGIAPSINESSTTFAPGQGLSISGSHSSVGQTSRIEYYNTTGPDVLWSRIYGFNDRETDSVRLANSERAFVAATSEREDWNEGILPAQVTAGPDMPFLAGVNDILWPCHGCRQGDTLRIRALASSPYAGAVGQFSDAGDPSHHFQVDFPVEETHLFRGDTELPPKTDDFGFTFYTLRGEEDTYRFTHVFRDLTPMPHSATTVATTWTFRSERPDTDNVGWPHFCIDTILGDTNPCAWLPLIYLHYKLGLAPDDNAPAGRPHTFTVTGQQGSSAVSLAGLKMWTSPNDGSTWTPAHVTPGPDHSYQVFLTNPTLAESPTDTVAIKAEAWDGEGNKIEQIITDAYRLVAPPHPPATADNVQP